MSRMSNPDQGLAQFSNRVLDGINVLAQRRLISIFAVFFLSFGGSWVISAFRGIPVPYIHDEFSYLLAGDTFAHGRITNPVHPMWIYFETFHVLQYPTYMSRYPPGQGVFLAIGQMIFGKPIYGVWLSAGLMCAAISWMLYAWLPPRWALMGGLVAALQFGVFTYWSQSYWGGAVAAMGGAMVFGALPRVIKYQRIRDVLLLGVGTATLFNTRPLEGLLVGIPVGCLVLPWKVKWRLMDESRIFKKAVVPLTLLILAMGIFMCYYNKKITGHAFVFPHLLYAKQYVIVPQLIFQPLYPSVHYNHQVLADDFRIWEIGYYNQKRHLNVFLQDTLRDTCGMFMFFLGFPLAFPSFFMTLQAFNSKNSLRIVLALCIILLMFGLSVCPARAHYAAPLTCFAVWVITMGLRYVSLLKLRNIKIGGSLVIFLVILQLCLNINSLRPFQRAISLAVVKQETNGHMLPGAFSREELKDMLIKLGGKHLVIVKYPPYHDCHWEWVFNDADIDASPIVWARDMGQQGNGPLLKYFKDRKVWDVEINWDAHISVDTYPSFRFREV
jgi:hypothetical protein